MRFIVVSLALLLCGYFVSCTEEIIQDVDYELDNNDPSYYHKRPVSYCNAVGYFKGEHICCGKQLYSVRTYGCCYGRVYKVNHYACRYKKVVPLYSRRYPRY